MTRTIILHTGEAAVSEYGNTVFLRIKYPGETVDIILCSERDSTYISPQSVSELYDILPVFKFEAGNYDKTPAGIKASLALIVETEE